MHLAFLSLPAPGHINPMLPLATELTRRGHRVSFATGESMLRSVRTTGAWPIALPTELIPPPIVAGTFTAPDLAVLLKGILDYQRTCLSLTEEYFQHDKPDAVCSDMLDTTGQLLARKLGVPNIALITNFAANPESPVTETFWGDFDFSNPELLEVQRQMTEFAEHNGGIELPDPFSDVTAPLNLVFIPSEFQPHSETFDDRFQFIGPSLRQRELTEQWRPRDPDAPLVFISLGTAFNDRLDFFQSCLEAFDGGPYQVAMAVGDRADISNLVVPDNFEIRQHFPQLAVLRNATVFLTHSGMGSTMESLYCGVPMVSAPQVPEQQANARRARELDLGRILESTTSAAIRETVEVVAKNDGIRSSVANMREVISNCGGASAGADAIQDYLAG